MYQEMKSAYESNEKFRDYVDKFSKDYNKTIDEALHNKIVEIVYKAFIQK